MLDRVEAALAELGVRGCKVLVATSGGLDSTALAHAVAALRQRLDLKLALGHVNHGLRGAESDGDERAVAELSRQLDADFASERVDPESLRSNTSSRSRPSPQEAARSVRRAALQRLQLRTDSQYIATAHHADDQAETVLMRILRGCGPDSLGGIGESSPDGSTVRPLLGLTREEIHSYATRHGLAWRQDASNADLRYTRNRIRQQLVPGLIADFNPRLLRAIGDLAEAQRRETEWLESLVREEAGRVFDRQGPSLRIRAEGWARRPEGLARRLVKRALIEQGGGRELSRANLLRALTFLRDGKPGTTIELPGGLRLQRESADAFRLFAG